MVYKRLGNRSPNFVSFNFRSLLAAIKVHTVIRYCSCTSSRNVEGRSYGIKNFSREFTMRLKRFEKDTISRLKRD